MLIFHFHVPLVTSETHISKKWLAHDETSIPQVSSRQAQTVPVKWMIKMTNYSYCYCYDILVPIVTTMVGEMAYVLFNI